MDGAIQICGHVDGDQGSIANRQTAWGKSGGDARRSLIELFSIRQFIRYGLRTQDFVISQEAIDGISLTPLGQELHNRLLARYGTVPEGLGKFGVFLTFHHQDLFVDVERTQSGPLRELIHTNILGGRLRYPWVFDHMLYDRAFEHFREVPDRISAEDTIFLLRDTPSGVFQLGRLVVGPFGLLESSQSRVFGRGRTSSCRTAQTRRVITLTSAICRSLALRSPRFLRR